MTRRDAPALVLLNANEPFVWHSAAPAEEARAPQKAMTAISTPTFENFDMRVPSVGRDANVVASRRWRCAERDSAADAQGDTAARSASVAF